MLCHVGQQAIFLIARANGDAKSAIGKILGMHIPRQIRILMPSMGMGFLSGGNIEWM